MLKCIHCSLLAGVVLFSAGAVHAQQGGFEGNSPAGYIANYREVDDDVSLVTADDLDGQTVMRITCNNRTYVQFRPMPVEAGRTYRLSFKGRWVNEETYETNPSFEVVLGPASLSQVDVLPVATVDFYDKDNKLISTAAPITTLYGQWKDYRIAFTTPPGTTSIRPKWMTGRNLGHVLITRPTLDQLAAPQRGLVLDFTQDNANASGSAYGLQLDQRIRKSPDGELLVYNLQDRTQDFLIGPAGKYRLRVEGHWPKGPQAVTVLIKGEKNRQIGVNQLKAAASNDGDVFTVPENATGIQLTVRDVLLRKITIEPAE